MIRAPDVEIGFAAPPQRAATPALPRQLLHLALFVAVLLGPLVFVEPSPYEVALALLAFLCIVAGVSFDVKILPLAALLILFNIGGMLPLPGIQDDGSSLIYALVSFYLAFSAVIYACIFTEDTAHRLTIMRRAYFVAAFFASVVGIAGYYGLISDAQLYGRARSTFKDPNVFGPFLILPILFALQSIIARGVRVRHVALLLVMLLALLLSFSRGAWAHFALSALILLLLTFLTAPNIAARFRLIGLSLASLVALAGLLAVALSFSSIGDLFEQRAKLTQSYDVGSGGRFDLQSKAVDTALENPAGLGPLEFARTFGVQQHNVYLQSFIVYGWLGGFAYITLLILTLAIGIRLSFVATPWQPYLIAGVATFCGEVAEGFVIDTDHWRHFYLILGMIWGLSAATLNATNSRRFSAA